MAIDEGRLQKANEILFGKIGNQEEDPSYVKQRTQLERANERIFGGQQERDDSSLISEIKTKKDQIARANERLGLSGEPDRGFLGNLIEKHRIGWQALDYEFDANKISTKLRGTPEADAERESLIEGLIKKEDDFRKEVPEIEGSNWLEETSYSVAQMLPFIEHSMAAGYGGGVIGDIAGRAVGAGTAIALGNLPGTAAFPEETATVPALSRLGGKIGQAIGGKGSAFEVSRRQGQGRLYLDLRREGFSDDVAYPISQAGSILYGAVEQDKLFTMFGKQATAQAKSKIIRSALTEVLKKYAGRVGKETLEEGIQGFIMEGAEQVASYLDPEHKNPKAWEAIKKSVTQGVKDAQESISPLSMLSILGLRGDVKAYQAEVNEQGNIILDEKAADEITAPEQTAKEKQAAAPVIQAEQETPPVEFTPEEEEAFFTPEETAAELKPSDRIAMQAEIAQSVMNLKQLGVPEVQNIENIDQALALVETYSDQQLPQILQSARLQRAQMEKMVNVAIEQEQRMEQEQIAQEAGGDQLQRLADFMPKQEQAAGRGAIRLVNKPIYVAPTAEGKLPGEYENLNRVKGTKIRFTTDPNKGVPLDSLLDEFNAVNPDVSLTEDQFRDAIRGRQQAPSAPITPLISDEGPSETDMAIKNMVIQSYSSQLNNLKQRITAAKSAAIRSGATTSAHLMDQAGQALKFAEHEITTEQNDKIIKEQLAIAEHQLASLEDKEIARKQPSKKPSLRQMAELRGIQLESSGLNRELTTMAKEVRLPPNEISLEENKAAFNSPPIDGIIHPSVQQVADLKLRMEEMFSDLGGWLTKATSITKAFRGINAEKTGFALKTLAGHIITGQELGAQRVKELSVFIEKIKNKTPLEIAMICEGSMEAETQAEKDLKEAYTDMVNMDEEILKNNNIIKEGFFDRVKTTLESDLVKLNVEKKFLLSPVGKVLPNSQARLAEIDTAINETKDALAKTQNKQYVPLNPVVLASLERNKNQDNTENKHFFDNKRRFANFRQILGRKTILLKDLVDSGFVQEGDIDIRSTMAYYTAYYNEKLAQKAVIDAAKQDGLLLKYPAQGFVPVSKLLDIPAMKNLYIHEALADYFEDNMSVFKYKSKADLYISRVLGWVKMKQFINPIFVPANNIFQAAMKGVFFDPKFYKELPGYAKAALEAVKNRNDDYHVMQDLGVFSTIEQNHFSSYKKEINNLINKYDGRNSTGAKVLLDYAMAKTNNPFSVVEDIYSVAHNVTWTVDKYQRAITYYYFRSKGMSATESAKTTAEAHGDYADVPVSTRRKINKVLFTGTFKIAMTQFYLSSLKGTMNYAKNIALNKDYGLWEKVYGKGVSKADISGLITTISTVGLLVGKTMLMQKVFGAEVVEWSRKYAVPSETDNGMPKDINVTFATPFNLTQRYWYRLFAKKPGQFNIFDRFLDSMSYELHPLYRTFLRLSVNQDHDGKEITIPYGDPAKNLLYASQFILNDTVRLFNLIPSGSQKDRELKEAIKNSGLSLPLRLMQVYSFQYADNPLDIKTKQKIMSEITKAQQRIQNGIKIDDERYKDPATIEDIKRNLLKATEEQLKRLD